jgi:myo-inositol-1(or 4)-monophosphatase
LKPWDVAAGALLVQEAGGKITSGTSRGLDLFSGTFLVSNGFLHPAMTKVLAAARTCKSFKDLKKCYAAITARGE